MTKIKVKKNIWGNYGCFIGARKVLDYGSDFDALEWLSEKLKEGGYALSGNSDFDQSAVDAHRARMATPVRQFPI